MGKRVSILEWQFVENDTDWIGLSVQPLTADATSIAPTGKSMLSSLPLRWDAVIFLLLLASAGGWYWRINQSRSPQRAGIVGDQVQLSQPVVSPDHNALVARVMDDLRREFRQMDSSTLTGILTSSSTADLGLTLSILDIQGDQAIILIVKPAARGTPVYGQTRFYERTAEGWRQPLANIQPTQQQAQERQQHGRTIDDYEGTTNFMPNS